MAGAGTFAVFYRDATPFAVFCLIFAVMPQLLGIAMFREWPSESSILDLAAYALGVLVGSVGAGMFTYQFRPSTNQLSPPGEVLHCRLTESQLLFLGALCFLPLLPDSIVALTLSQQEDNVRYVLLNDPSVRILNPKLIMVLSEAFVTITWFTLIFVRPLRQWIALVFIGMYIVESFIWASRTEFILIGILYFLNARRMVTLRHALFIVVAVFLLGLYTIVIQGRVGSGAYINATLFYATYFAYPVYLDHAIPFVFHKLSVAYSLIGYPADVVETYFANIPGTIARHLEEIATYSYIGEDIRGNIHSDANVLYPQYGIIGNTIGYLGVFVYYSAVVFWTCVLAVRFKKYAYWWRVLIFLEVWYSARTFALGVPGNWFLILFSFLLCLFSMRTICPAKMPPPNTSL